MSTLPPTNPPTFTKLIDLASERLGARALFANDEFFAPKENLLKPARAIFIPGKFTEFGKWMDGWESRRRRVPGHDWCVIALGRPGLIHGINVDTGHFKGNQPESCTLEAAELPAGVMHDVAAVIGPDVRWTPVTSQTLLNADAEHFIAALPSVLTRRFTHVRLNIFPDGGVARLRVHGQVLPDWEFLAAANASLDLAAAENAGLVIDCNDMHFGSRHNLIMPGRAENMGDGWETRRKRGLKGGEHDWCIVQLGHRGVIRSIEVDTNHFKGNFPESCQIEVADAGGTHVSGADFDHRQLAWATVLLRTPLKADTRHHFERELQLSTPCTHARLRIFPDGGVSRLRLHGILA